MLLAIDVGNTNIVLGVFDGAKLSASWRLLTLRERTADEVGLMTVGLFAHRQLDIRRIDAIVMGSVVPVLTPILRNMCATYFGRDPLVVDPVTNAGMPILYERPAEVGSIPPAIGHARPIHHPGRRERVGQQDRQIDLLGNQSLDVLGQRPAVRQCAAPSRDDRRIDARHHRIQRRHRRSGRDDEPCPRIGPMDIRQCRQRHHGVAKPVRRDNQDPFRHQRATVDASRARDRDDAGYTSPVRRCTAA